MPSLRLSVLAIAAMLAAALAGCSSVKIRTEYDPKAPYRDFKTYAWLAAAPGPEQATPIRNPEIRAQVVAVVDRELKKKGLTLVPIEAKPDLLVTVIGWANSRVEVTSYGYAYGGAYVYGAYGPGVAVPVAQVHEYAEGTLILDLIDEKTRNLVWRGTANDTLTSPDPSAIRGAAEEAAKRLVAEYPPKGQGAP